MGHRVVSTETFPEKPESGIPKKRAETNKNNVFICKEKKLN
jgi:hypothetical protein